MPAEPYFELPISNSKLKTLVQYRVGSHWLPVEQGRMTNIPRYLRRCTLCRQHAPGVQRRYSFECPYFHDVRAQYPQLFSDGRDSMRNLMWHRDQKAVVDLVIGILDEVQT